MINEETLYYIERQQILIENTIMKTKQMTFPRKHTKLHPLTLYLLACHVWHV